MAIRIITDSTSDIPKALEPELGIEILPLTLHFGETEYRVGVDIGAAEFYRRLREAKALPTTSQVTVAAFEDAFRRAKEAGDEVLCATISPSFSGTYQSACIARESVGPEGITVIDSGSASAGIAALVYLMARLRDEGRTAAEIAAVAEEKKKDVILLVALEELRYLVMGGRLAASSAFAGKVLGIKPIVSVDNGALGVVHKARGNANAQKYLAQRVQEEADLDLGLWIIHSDAPEEAQSLMTMVKKPLQRFKPIVQELGAVIGTHAGPGAVGAVYFRKS